jgi:hypothetical protein
MATSTSIQTSLTDVPEVLRPYITGPQGALPAAQTFLGQGYDKIYGDPLKAAGLAGSGRIAGIAPMQQQIGSELSRMGTPSQYAMGTQATQAGLGALNQATNAFGNIGQIGAPNLSQFQMQAPQSVGAPNINYYQASAPGNISAQNLQTFQTASPRDIAAQNLQNFQVQGARDVNAPQGLQTYQMSGPQQYGGESVGQYMSPYVQQVMDVQKQEALRDFGKGLTAQNLGAARQGTYGGARNILANTEAQRNLQTQLGGIQATGLQSAFQNAQQQFNTSQAQQQAANAQNLQAALGVQQLGTGQNLQAQLANQQAQQAAQQANLQSALGVQQLGSTQGLQAQQSNQAAQQAAQMANLQAALGVQQFGAGQSLQAQQANQAAQQGTSLANLQAMLGTQQLGAGQNLQSQLANQAAQQATGQTNLQALLGVQQLGAGQSLEAQRANQAAQLQAAQGYGQLGQTYGSLGQTYGALGTAQQASDIDRIKTQGAYGDLQRGLQQQQLDTQYQDLMTRLNYPLTQAETMANLARGVPLTQTASSGSQTTPPPSFASQLAGLGLSGLGLYNMFGNRQ